MSAPTNKTPTIGVPAKEEGSQQSQPMDLAPKSNQNIPAGSTVTAIPTRFVGEAPAGIFLVRPTGSPVPVISLPTPPVSTTPATTVSTAQIQPGPVTVTVPMPITVARFQAAIRPGTTVTIAPRVVPAPLVTSTTGTYAGQPSHVPKGAAAVASIAIPRSAVGGAAAAMRPVPSTNSASSQVTGFSVANRATRPNMVSVRPAALETGTAAGPISGAWVTMTPTVATSAQPPPVPTLYKATSEATGVKTPTGPTNLIITGQSSNKPAPILTPAPIAGNSVSIIGQPKVSTVPGSAPAITLLSVRGPAPSVTQRPVTNPPSAVTVGPRPSTEVIKTVPPLMPSGPVQQPQRTPSMTITSTSNVQGVEKHFVKTVSGAVPSSSTQTGTVRNLSTGPIQIAARTMPPVLSSSLSVSNPSNAGALKNIAPIASATGKVAQPGIAVQLPQMTVSAVAASKVGVPPQTPAVAGIRPVTSSTGTPVVGGGNITVGGARTYLVTTTQATAPSTNVIPVAKVLPQPVIVTSSGAGVSAPVIATGIAPPRVINQKQAGTITATGGPLPNPSGFLLLPADSTVTSVVVAPSSSSGEALPSAHAHPRPALQASNETTTVSSNTGGSVSATPVVQPHPPPIQSNTPSKLLGSSPRPSILRKRDYEGAPLKAQKNLTTTLTTPATSTPSAGAVPAVLPTTPAISPPSPRRLDLGSNTGGVGTLTPGGPNGDSSRSSSGGSTTLSASSSPGIPPDNEEPVISSISSSAAVLGKALSNIQVKQEALDNAETSGAIASLMRMSSSASVHLPNPPEVQMSPRKKPRKQQLLGQELQEVRSSDDEMPASLPLKDLKPENSVKSEPKEVATVVKRPRVSLISTYRQSWKARNHHFTRYSDVKLKDERRPTVTDLANQKQVLQKVHGWKVFHLSAQIEEMAHSESQIHERLSAVLEVMEKLGAGKNSDRDLMRVNELIKGNLQRSKVIRDGLEDSKNQVQKIFDHKPRAEDIIQRYMYKRLAKKREKM